LLALKKVIRRMSKSAGDHRSKTGGKFCGF